MTARFPGYDVLAKRNTLSWNEPTRRAIDRRLAVHPGPRFFDEGEWRILGAVCARVLPQPADRAPVPIPAYVDEKMFTDATDGYRLSTLLPEGDCWKALLAGLDAAARARHGTGFPAIPADEQDALLAAMQRGELEGPEWRGMPCDVLFARRVLHDVVSTYYAHPTAWSEMGWSGPASPRGFVRLDADMRDPWEAAEARPGEEEKARRENCHVV